MWMTETYQLGWPIVLKYPAYKGVAWNVQDIVVCHQEALKMSAVSYTIITGEEHLDDWDLSKFVQTQVKNAT